MFTKWIFSLETWFPASIYLIYLTRATKRFFFRLHTKLLSCSKQTLSDVNGIFFCLFWNVFSCVATKIFGVRNKQYGIFGQSGLLEKNSSINFNFDYKLYLLGLSKLKFLIWFKNVNCNNKVDIQPSFYVSRVQNHYIGSKRIFFALEKARGPNNAKELWKVFSLHCQPTDNRELSLN